MPGKQHNRIRAWIFRALMPFAATMAASGAQAALVISTASTSDVTCSGGTCTATAADAVLNATVLKTFLHRSDVRVDSGPANTIAVNATLNWTQGSRLTLIANTGIAVTQPIVVEGHGAVTLTTADTSAGAVAFTSRGRLDFWSRSSSLIINGNTYKLANDVASLASAIAHNMRGYFALAKSYNANADTPYTASPVPVLYGSLNGLGHAISNLKIHSTEANAGFIARLVAFRGAAPSVSNLTLSQIDLSGGEFANVGGLAGFSEGGISHVRVSGRVQGNSSAGVGGIIGHEDGRVVPISDSRADVTVSGGAELGGVVGYSVLAGILRCASTGTVQGQFSTVAGGLAGYLDWGSYLSVAGNWSSARVTGGDYAGGLVGALQGQYTLSDNYVIGAVSSYGRAAGGLVGFNGNSSSILRSYARGPVTELGGAPAGGVIGIDAGNGAYASAYWDRSISGISNPAQGAGNMANDPGLTGLTHAQIKLGLPAGFDPAVWGQNPQIINGYPYLLANPPP